jgi:hypothetical protein
MSVFIEKRFQRSLVNLKRGLMDGLHAPSEVNRKLSRPVAIKREDTQVASIFAHDKPNLEHTPALPLHQLKKNNSLRDRIAAPGLRAHKGRLLFKWIKNAASRFLL